MAEALLGAGKFQSTLSVRRATLRPTPSPAGSDISIHALRKESDDATDLMTKGMQFQSTLSVRRATWQFHSARA